MRNETDWKKSHYQKEKHDKTPYKKYDFNYKCTSMETIDHEQQKEELRQFAMLLKKKREILEAISQFENKVIYDEKKYWVEVHYIHNNIDKTLFIPYSKW